MLCSKKPVLYQKNVEIADPERRRMKEYDPRVDFMAYVRHSSEHGECSEAIAAEERLTKHGYTIDTPEENIRSSSDPNVNFVDIRLYNLKDELVMSECKRPVYVEARPCGISSPPARSQDDETIMKTLGVRVTKFVPSEEKPLSENEKKFEEYCKNLDLIKK